MITWQYDKVISIGIPIEKLNELGKEGWEHYMSNGNVHFIKRQTESVGITEVNQWRSMLSADTNPQTEVKRRGRPAKV